MKDILDLAVIVLLLLLIGPFAVALAILGRIPAKLLRADEDILLVKWWQRIGVALIGMIVWIIILFIVLGVLYLILCSKFQNSPICPATSTSMSVSTLTVAPTPALAWTPNLTQTPTPISIGVTPLYPLGSFSVETPTTNATPFFPSSPSPTASAPERLIESNEWCVFIVPEGEKMHIRDIVGRFLQEGDVPEDYRDQVFEATGGEVWYNVWSEDVWDVNPLPQDQRPDGQVITARVALGFVRNVTDCINNGGRIRRRPSILAATPQSTPTVLVLTPIQDGYWCVFTVPEGSKMTIRDIVGRFLQIGDSPDNYLEEVFEATSGTVWYNIWSVDAWDRVPLPEETLKDGTVVTARLGLGFVKFKEECIDNGGMLWERYNPNP